MCFAPNISVDRFDIYLANVPLAATTERLCKTWGIDQQTADRLRPRDVARTHNKAVRDHTHDSDWCYSLLAVFSIVHWLIIDVLCFGLLTRAVLCSRLVTMVFMFCLVDLFFSSPSAIICVCVCGGGGGATMLVSARGSLSSNVPLYLHTVRSAE